MEHVRWGDEDDSDDDEPGDQHLFLGGGQRYPKVLRVGDVEVHTLHDWMLLRLEVKRAMEEMGVLTEEQIDTWMVLLDEDLGAGSAEEDQLAIVEEMEREFSLVPLPKNWAAGVATQLASFEGDAAAASENLAQTTNDPEVKADLAQLAAEHTIEGLINKRDSATIAPFQPTCQDTIRLRMATPPPSPPSDIPLLQLPVRLVLVPRRRGNRDVELTQGDWRSLLGIEVLGEDDRCFEGGAADCEISGLTGQTEPASLRFQGAHDITHVSTAGSGSSHSSREAFRPAFGKVFFEYEDGCRINVGSHSVVISVEETLELDFRSADAAIAELFTSVGGEGMTCATPSHELHQLVSAVIAAALADGTSVSDVLCEDDGYDVTMVDPELGDLNLEITTTAGIWNKKMGKHPMIVVSKYDISACLLGLPEPRAVRVFQLGIANCLAVEHPCHYGTQYPTGMKDDLRLQLEINDMLSSLSQNTVAGLAHMSYDATMLESVDEMRKVDIHAPGMPYLEKAKIVRDGIMALSREGGFAIPPLPVEPIAELPLGAYSFELLGDNVHVEDWAITQSAIGMLYKPTDNAHLLEAFPAVGRCDGDDAWGIARVMNETFLEASGATHCGPAHVVKTPMPMDDLWDACGNLYGASAAAQLAEVRADLAKHIDQTPVPAHGAWASRRLMKGKVQAWYRIRDPINSPKGYRIDWFAVSAFQVLGSTPLVSTCPVQLHLWPRQRMRSQEMDMARSSPRALKAVLFSIVEKARATGAEVSDIRMAWQRLALTSITATWGCGKTFVVCRHLATAFSSPASPFHTMVTKLVKPNTLACVLFLDRVVSAIDCWTSRDTYIGRCALIGLPRAFSQLENYWQVWVPDEIADPNKHLTDCCQALYDEVILLDRTFDVRVADLASQLKLLKSGIVSLGSIRRSLRASIALPTEGKLGWNVFGSLGSGHALAKRGDPRHFDVAFSRGGKARRTVDSLTVRHSVRVTAMGDLETGTVAEMILREGLDDYLSTMEPTYRFLYGKGGQRAGRVSRSGGGGTLRGGPGVIYVNHAKDGELKDREISIACPDGRIMLNKGEQICGAYGKHTNVDMLKRSDKDANFYRLSADALLSGGSIQASDASRYSPMMSNVAVAVTLHGLGSIGGSMHLKATAVTYKVLGLRRMLVPGQILQELEKRLEQPRGIEEKKKIMDFKVWVTSLPIAATQDGFPQYEYTEAAHTGQGMSHHSTSLMHAGALIISLDAADHAMITVEGGRVAVVGTCMVTSDDSTVIANADVKAGAVPPSRARAQRASKIYLMMQRAARKVSLRLVSVMPNLPKEKISGVCGEFNSQDNGIGRATPILGFRELICEMVPPGSSSLVADYLNAHAMGQSVAAAGQGLVVGVVAQRLMIDAVEARWRLTSEERGVLLASPLLPNSLIRGCDTNELMSSPAALLSIETRQRLLSVNSAKNMESEDLDPHVQDSVFGPLMHARVSMRRQHTGALTVINNLVELLKKKGLPNQARMLEESRRSTMSSARSRGLGRVGARARGRFVTPKPYLKKEFARAPLMEQTLEWISYLPTLLASHPIDTTMRDTAIARGKRVDIARARSYQYPLPARRKRMARPRLRKPVYLIKPYGATPWGRHVVNRSKAEVVEKFGDAERKRMQTYLAGVSYRCVTEHVLYGSTFVISWSAGRSGVLIGVNPSQPIQEQHSEGVLWGDFGPLAIHTLRQIEEQVEGRPLLALMYGAEGEAHYHCVHMEGALNYVGPFDPGEEGMNSLRPIRLIGGEPAFIVNQGTCTKREWASTGPSAEEISAFQDLPAGDYSNKVIEDLMVGIEKAENTTSPSSAVRYVDPATGATTVYGLKPGVNRRPWTIPGREDMWAYYRGKCLASAALGGYWYSARKGVALRAFMRGQAGTDNVWTGGVLGWRMNFGSEPAYHYTPPSSGGMQSVAVLGGVDDEAVLARFENNALSRTSVCVSGKDCSMISSYQSVTPSRRVASLFLTINGGTRFPDTVKPAFTFIDYRLPLSVFAPALCTVGEAWNELHALLDAEGMDFY